jgi:hypothetical protein
MELAPATMGFREEYGFLHADVLALAASSTLNRHAEEWFPGMDYHRHAEPRITDMNDSEEDEEPSMPDLEPVPKPGSAEANVGGTDFPPLFILPNGVAPVVHLEPVLETECLPNPPVGEPNEPATERVIPLAQREVVLFQTLGGSPGKKGIFTRMKTWAARHTPLAREQIVHSVNGATGGTQTEANTLALKDQKAYMWFWQRDTEPEAEYQWVYYFRDRFTHSTRLPVYSRMVDDILTDKIFVERRSRLEDDAGKITATTELAIQHCIAQHPDYKAATEDPAVLSNTEVHLHNQVMLMALRFRSTKDHTPTTLKTVLFRRGERTNLVLPHAPRSKSLARARKLTRSTGSTARSAS